MQVAPSFVGFGLLFSKKTSKTLWCDLGLLITIF